VSGGEAKQRGWRRSEFGWKWGLFTLEATAGVVYENSEDWVP
jgi:hypothetical protein